ncbi:ABC transporter substrate-binding protein [Streptomyces formicae]|uniref:ABC transporter substrate-binding protein n=1 Tax=Streptomyces formicae TaxID=1616117 RepID=UPI00131B4D32|nr:ABC transporter substrate-binding protein [Streptomyces formicae]
MAACLVILATTTWLIADANEESHTNPKGVGIPRSVALDAEVRKVPERIIKRGAMIVGTDLRYAPMEFVRDGKATGLDIDIARALGEKMGVEVDFANEPFETLTIRLFTDDVDLVMSSMADTPQRQKQVDFVDYLSVGVSILTKRGNPHHLKSLDDLCGKTVTLSRGTTAHDVVDKLQKGSCKNGIDVVPQAGNAEALALVRAGRADAYLSDQPLASYNAKAVGGGQELEVVGQQADPHPWGIAVTKGSLELRDALVRALALIIVDGEYQRILTKWGSEQGAVKRPVINGG